jgi:aspartyl-tRNA(Asn)/glutamyl-tRNA(Gln) amidotransferase subunit A
MPSGPLAGRKTVRHDGSLNVKKGFPVSDALARPLSDLARALDERRVTALELAEAAIVNHGRWDAQLKAYMQWAPELARQLARTADAAFASHVRVGPLQGIPVAVKDNYAMNGFPTYAGSKHRLPPVWEQDGPLMANVRRQLGVFMGKTHMVEFAFGGTGVNAHWGCPRNPWDAAQPRSPGGSSSGAGVSLHEGSALLAFGSDTAGSVRIPAAATGTVGLKITAGRWPADGIVPLSRVYDTPGILVRSAADAVYCFGALDPAWGDARAFERAAGSCELGGVRIGLGDPLMWEGCAPGIAEAAKEALDALARAGARVSAKDLPEAKDANAIFLEGGVSGPELRAFLDLDLPEWIDSIDPINAPVIAKTASLSASVYLGRQYRLAKLAAAAQTRFDDIDVLACPTLCVTPPALREIEDSESHWRVNRLLVRNTVPGNYLGLCAITLPVGRDRAGMPVGLQLTARGGQEERLLAIAWAAERLLGLPADRLGRPPLLA